MEHSIQNVVRKYPESDKRQVALDRADELKSQIKDYLQESKNIPTGLMLEQTFHERKRQILNYFGAAEDDWNSWQWQLRNRISDVEVLKKLLHLTGEDAGQIEMVSKKFRWSVSPYYLSLMETDNLMCPVRMQGIPSIQELQDIWGKDDPMAEEFTSPAPRITRRYADRLIINVTNQCAMFCRHCQRRRNIGEVDRPAPLEEIKAAIEYIRKNPEIRDVLITGGDPLTLSDGWLDWILSELDAIPHVEIKRIGTRTPVTMPQRITQELCDMLERHHPLYLNTHFNHPKEVTAEAMKATRMLAKAGIPLGNQAVLLKGINNNPHVMKKLNHELLKIHVRPYYIFHAKPVKGTTHFVTTIQEGLEIMENLRGYTSGLAIPQYIINAPGGAGKTPLLPQYLISMGKDYAMIRTWEGKVFRCSNGI
ncbi:glutamate 2,3-aminomutase [Desulfotomaculum arcticum]|uniref:Glutamate 2,3-aminomutase n=1 Tax=Desulfotruncus arcticus DSM 17038 TaxID=1121424 RepID=A0A1I2Y4R1_9FIRM|nr:glutamate 2,3-aminomutase [Desulfotruncus arcticus]SFH19331.1 glutamate 2,3-aminomutase [Desulfotomaculum arcticum] [Desulfotruncus arcticus DSM 17038]